MIKLMKSVVLNQLILNSVDLDVNSEISGGGGSISFERNIQFMTPDDTDKADIKQVKLVAYVSFVGKNDNGDILFSLKAVYNSFFDVVDNKHFFEHTYPALGNYCFSLVYPYILSDTIPLLNRAGFYGITLPQSSTPDDDDDLPHQENQ